MTPTWICSFFHGYISMFGIVFVFALFVLIMCLVFVGFYNCFYNCFFNCYIVLMFALLVANWPFRINKFDLIWFDLSDFSKGQAFEYFHCYKHAHIVISCCAYCFSLFLFYFCFRSCLLYIFVCMYFFFFSFDATILVNKKDVYINRQLGLEQRGNHLCPQRKFSLVMRVLEMLAASGDQVWNMHITIQFCLVCDTSPEQHFHQVWWSSVRQTHVL